ncbi:hypothetical protein BDA96_09G083100 [Sorghum bicolor]|uniref:Uncharacterized protein n=1 Tax=Sorghum bicolor TaxID=4558 RepID=A0A921Q8C8_SORBI|nr:hypothetical protein BDA96_09G083100 [Sorghum bicolor]
MLDNTFLCSLTHVQWCVVVEGCIVLLVCNFKRRTHSYQKRKRGKKRWACVVVGCSNCCLVAMNSKVHQCNIG